MKASMWCVGVFAFLVASAAWSQERAVVIDGDTLEQDGITYRIHGIDAPEYGQKCGSSPCGKLAVEAMAVLAEGKRLSCEAIEEDTYGRTIAKCVAEGIDVGAQMVRLGQAWAFRRFSDVYVPEETLAKAEGVGVWQGKAIPPWEYRTQRWNSAAQSAPEGCPIKGNISQNGKIYHPPWSPWYGRTKINTARGERWFCNEGKAVQAGWRAPKWR
jgi:endonuclease YncB( thermonuclease family)